MKDLYHNVTIQQALTPVVATANKTSSTIDRQGYNSATVVFLIGASGDTLSGSVYWTLKLQESDTDSSYTDVVLADLLNSSATVVIDDPSEDEVAVTFAYRGNKRYLQAVATKTGTHTNGTPMGILAVKGHPSIAPTV